ncbi:6181_t:CDS:2 [Rhizophagus irregularis]|nr:6181_t:CDS:2 [Rhizophagus irregularis]
MPRQITKRARTVESRKKDLLIDNNIQPPPVIKVPCPPIVTCDDFVRNRPKAKVDIKSPNSFFVYRTAFVKQLLSENHKFKMTQVSKWASIYWRKESDKTKMAYKDMAQIIDKEFQERRKKIKECIDFSAVSPKSTSSTYSPICPASPASPISPFIKDEFSLSEFPSINENFYEYIPLENSISPICDFNEKFIWISNDSNPEYYNAPIYVEPTFNEYLPQYYYESEK